MALWPSSRTLHSMSAVPASPIAPISSSNRSARAAAARSARDAVSFWSMGFPSLFFLGRSKDKGTPFRLQALRFLGRAFGPPSESELIIPQKLYAVKGGSSKEETP